MPLGERERRWQAMMEHLVAHDAHRWQRGFLGSLGSVEAQRRRKLSASMRRRPLQQPSEAMRGGGLPKEEVRRPGATASSAAPNDQTAKPVRWDA